MLKKGHGDAMLYERKAISTPLPLIETKRLALVNHAPNSRARDGFFTGDPGRVAWI